MKYKGSFIAGAALGITLIGSMAFAATDRIVTSDSSFTDMPQLAEDASIDQQAEWKQQFTTWAESTGNVLHFSGQKTRGATIEINGKPVKLPDDVELGGLVVADEGLEKLSEYKKHLPFYVLVQGNSRIMIGKETGVVVNEILDPVASKALSASGPFDFLKDSIKGYLPEVKR